MINRIATLAAVMLVGFMYAQGALAEEKKSQRVFEMRTYLANEGKFEAMHTRFRDHAIRLFKKHGMEMVGFWVPTDPEKKNTLVYILAFESPEAMKQKWDAFRKDPEWQKAKSDSEKDGPLVGKVISETLKATDYSPIQ